MMTRKQAGSKDGLRFATMASIGILVLFSIALLPVAHVQAASNGVWWVGAQSKDSSALPNTGVEGKIQVLSQFFSGCLSFWVSEAELINGDWAQIGYYICDSSTPIAFYQIWNLPDNTIVGAGTTTVSTGSHTFSMYLTSGTTWAFALDGTVFGTYNMGSASFVAQYPIYALSEQSSVSSPQTISQVEFYTALTVLRSGTWQTVSSATSYGSSWGMSGIVQNLLMPADSLLVGSGLPVLAQGTSLWSGLQQLLIHSTSTSVVCSPSSLEAGSSTSCKASVTDTASGTLITPTGTVTFTSTGAGTFSSAKCTLASASCSVTYSPSAAGSPVITASYSGDSVHSVSSGTSALTVSTAPSQVTSPLGVDGSWACSNGSTAYCKVVATTSDPSDVIIVAEATQAGHVATAPTDTAGLTWVSLKDYSDGQIDLHLYYAKATAALSSDTITCNFNPNARSSCVALGISGASLTTIFDSNSALPCTAKGTSTSSSCSISTSNADDIVVGFVAAGCDVPVSAGSGFTIVHTETFCGPSVGAEYKIVSATQSSQPVAFALGSSSQEWVTIGDAIMQGTS
jgi:Bacterial Ig-like domain (group 3)